MGESAKLWSGALLSSCHIGTAAARFCNCQVSFQCVTALRHKPSGCLCPSEILANSWLLKVSSKQSCEEVHLNPTTVRSSYYHILCRLLAVQGEGSKLPFLIFWTPIFVASPSLLF